jgi:group I intron endonuclease
MNEFGHIYLINNKINNKKYVGQSINIKRRITEHIRNANNNDNHPLYHAFNKYG